GSTLSGVTFTFNTGGFAGLATNLYLPVSAPNTLGVNRSSVDPLHNDFFFAGESVKLTFSQPIKAIGAYFASNFIAGTATEFLFISTPVGIAQSGNALPAGTFGFPANALRFIGLISNTSFVEATLGITNPSPGNVG